VRVFLPELRKPSIESVEIGIIGNAASKIIGAGKPARKNWTEPTWIASPTTTRKRLRQPKTARDLLIAKTEPVSDSVSVRTTVVKTITFSRRPPNHKSHEECGEGKNPVEQKKQVPSSGYSQPVGSTSTCEGLHQMILESIHMNSNGPYCSWKSTNPVPPWFRHCVSNYSEKTDFSRDKGLSQALFYRSRELIPTPATIV